MKKIQVLLVILFALWWNTGRAQMSYFRYHATVFDNGTAYQNQSIDLIFSLLDEYNTVIYEETHSVTTDDKGHFEAFIGQGTATVGNWGDIDWGQDGLHFKVYISLDGLFYSDYDSFPLKFVPYAKYAERGGTVQRLGDLSDGYWDETNY